MAPTTSSVVRQVQCAFRIAHQTFLSHTHADSVQTVQVQQQNTNHRRDKREIIFTNRRATQ